MLIAFLLIAQCFGSVKKDKSHLNMQTARMVSPALPKNTMQVTIRERDWGIERCYRTSDGVEICTPALFTYDQSNKCT